AGAHYGLAFLLLQRGDPDGAAQHLKTFLTHPPRGPDAQKWIEHATQTLHDLRTSGGGRGGRRGTRARRRREDGKLLTRTVALLTLAAVCASKINTDLAQPVAIDSVLPDSGRVEVTDTFRPRARALNGIGDSVQAELSWASLDTAVLAVLDSTTGVSISKTIGAARLEARTGNLFSNPQTVTVLARLDSIRVLGAARNTVFAADSLSHSLS